MKKKVLSMILAGSMVAALLTGCGGGSTGTSTASSDAPTLNIYTWTEYVPDSVYEKFTEETGIKVNVSTYSSNEDLLAKMKSESEDAYDIIQPSDYMIEYMIQNDMLSELDKEKLPNIENCGDAYLNPSYDPDNKYSMPFQGGVAAIAVNTKKVDTEITSYADLFKPELANSMVVLDDFRAVIGLTERSMGLSMNESDPAKLEEVKEKLMTLKSNIKLYDSDSPKSALISEDCTVAVCWAAEIALAQAENPDIEIVFPTDGAYVFFDNWAIPKGSKNIDAAHEFINFMMDPEVEAMVAAEFPYLNANEAMLELMDDEYKNNKAICVPSEVMEKGEYVQNLDVDTLAIYDEMWTELKK